MALLLVAAAAAALAPPRVSGFAPSRAPSARRPRLPRPDGRSRAPPLPAASSSNPSPPRPPPHRPPPPTDDGRAYAQQTPHSGRHFLPSHPTYHSSRLRSVLRRANPLRGDARRTKRGRFVEGWYYRLTLPPPDGVSFVFIFSIDDPTSRGGRRPGTDLSLAALQVLGPDDGYLVQATSDDSRLWAWERAQGVGCTFEWKEGKGEGDEAASEAIDPEEWRRRVKSGFQFLPRSLQGRLRGHDGTAGGRILDEQGAEAECSFDMEVSPLSGWGDDADVGGGSSSSLPQQRSTAGWLASYAVFEPHWQVTMADGRAKGAVQWKGTTYEFADAPFYAEKNWGGEFPSRWYWVQCNAFEGYDRLSVTAGGGTRKIPFGQTESLGMVSVHYEGKFYEAVPWTGEMEWDVDPWGRWALRGRCISGDRRFEVDVLATLDPEKMPGVTLRAPTKDDGLTYYCRDSFSAATTLTLWELRYDEDMKDYVRVDGPPVIDCARSQQGGVEVGGGPWWDTWRGQSKMKQPMKGLVRFPYVLQNIKNRVFRRKL